MVIGKDGKKYPAKKKPRQPKTVMAVDTKDEERALSAIEQAQEALPDKVITTKRAGRIGREQDAQRRRQQSIPKRTALTDSLDIRRGVFEPSLEVGLSPEHHNCELLTHKPIFIIAHNITIPCESCYVLGSRV